jgi:glycosyl hydrolase family 10
MWSTTRSTRTARYRDTIWLEKLGPGYIVDAFRWAHQVDPKAQLFYNDYNIEDVYAKNTAVYDLVKTLRAQGVPVEGVGVQGHQTVSYAPATMQQNLKRFNDLGLDTVVTEADVRMMMPADPVELQAQANVYSTMLEACLITPRSVSFTVRGLPTSTPGCPAGSKVRAQRTCSTKTSSRKPPTTRCARTSPCGHTGSEVGAYCRYDSTSETGRVSAADSSSPNSRRARR